MLAIETKYQHIVLDELRVPYIAGTNIKVIELVLDRLAYGWSPEELQFQHPYLTMGQIHSSLAYYWDHQAELDLDIVKRLEKVEQIRKTIKPSPLESRLKEKGLI